MGTGKPLERVQRFLRFALLYKADCRVHQNDKKDDDGIADLAKQQGYRSSSEQHIDERVTELLKKFCPQRLWGSLRQFVSAVLLQSAFCLLLGNATFCISFTFHAQRLYAFLFKHSRSILSDSCTTLCLSMFKYDCRIGKPAPFMSFLGLFGYNFCYFLESVEKRK